MSTLYVAFDWSFYMQAFVTVDVTDLEGNRVVAPTPVSTSGETALTVPDGTYSVHAQLPSGDMATGHVALSGEARVLLSPERHSPREFLNWAYYLSQPGRGMLSEPLRDEDLAFWVREAGSWSTYPISLHQQMQQIPMPGLLDVYLQELDRTGRQEFIASFTLTMRDMQPRQLWLRVRNKLCAIPISLPTTEVLISASDDEVLVNVGNANGFAQSLLGYLDDADFVSARSVGPLTVATVDFAMARETLYEKERNPTAAAIAGYYLVRLAPNGARSDWHQWVRNLANWFPWLPDGAVIAGYAAMRAGHTATAVSYLLEASRRGLPFYMIGLRLLGECLHVLSTVPHERADEVRDALRWVTEALAIGARTTHTTMLRDDGESGVGRLVWTPSNVPAGGMKPVGAGV